MMQVTSFYPEFSDVRRTVCCFCFLSARQNLPSGRIEAVEHGQAAIVP